MDEKGRIIIRRISRNERRAFRKKRWCTFPHGLGWALGTIPDTYSGVYSPGDFGDFLFYRLFCLIRGSCRRAGATFVVAAPQAAHISRCACIRGRICRDRGCGNHRRKQTPPRPGKMGKWANNRDKYLPIGQGKARKFFNRRLGQY